MKKFLIIIFAVAIAVSGVSVDNAFAGSAQYKATVLDNAWDWATTLGKDGVEKQQILAKNKAERIKRHAEKMAKKASKDADKAAKDMKKKLGM